MTEKLDYRWNLRQVMADRGMFSTTDLAEPLKQRDLKVAKRLRFGARRAMIGVDLFNALNSGAILSYNNTFNAIWLQPLTILTARMAKITAEFTF